MLAKVVGRATSTAGTLLRRRAEHQQEKLSCRPVDLTSDMAQQSSGYAAALLHGVQQHFQLVASSGRTTRLYSVSPVCTFALHLVCRKTPSQYRHVRLVTLHMHSLFGVEVDRERIDSSCC
jgi:hypothetical protein